MNTIDIVLIILLALFFFQGWREGFVFALGRLIGAIIAFLAARAWSPVLSLWLNQWIHLSPGVMQFISFLLIFLIVDRLLMLVISLIAALLKIITSLPIIHSLNGLLGGLLGLAAGLVLIGSSVYLIQSLSLDPTLLSWTNHSEIARYAERIFYISLKFIL
ncbi:MAG TPA: CvpA family protein [Patescibacteria group bacterium]|nr:CvpA family protein [Patescibacteria group bacterium]